MKDVFDSIVGISLILKAQKFFSVIAKEDANLNFCAFCQIHYYSFMSTHNYNS